MEQAETRRRSYIHTNAMRADLALSADLRPNLTEGLLPADGFKLIADPFQRLGETVRGIVHLCLGKALHARKTQRASMRSSGGYIHHPIRLDFNIKGATGLTNSTKCVLDQTDHP
jgi:hypothetical protein